MCDEAFTLNTSDPNRAAVVDPPNVGGVRVDWGRGRTDINPNPDQQGIILIPTTDDWIEHRV